MRGAPRGHPHRIHCPSLIHPNNCCPCKYNMQERSELHSLSLCGGLPSKHPTIFPFLSSLDLRGRRKCSPREKEGRGKRKRHIWMGEKATGDGKGGREGDIQQYTRRRRSGAERGWARSRCYDAVCSNRISTVTELQRFSLTKVFLCILTQVAPSVF